MNREIPLPEFSSSNSVSEGKLGTEKIVDKSSIISCGSSVAFFDRFVALCPLKTEPNTPYFSKAI